MSGDGSGAARGTPRRLPAVLDAWRAGFGRALGWLDRWARTRPFRLGFALICLAVHISAVAHSGRSRFHARLNAAPANTPAFRDPAREGGPEHWDRLVFSRWDSGQYIGLGLRGYKFCPKRGLPIADYRLPACNLSFYPTYGLLGRWLGRLFRLPIDYALFAITLASSLVLLYLWTGPAIVDRVGVYEAYLSAILFNVFTNGFTLVMLMTEPLTLALTMGAFVALSRHRYLGAALLAGAASGLRITGVPVGAAMGIALLVQAYQRRPGTISAWVRRIGLLPLCVWGQLVLMGWYQYRFGDPLAYNHTHALAFKHELSWSLVLHPRTELLIHSIEQPLHEGVWLVLALLWFLLGHKEALRRFSAPERSFWYALFIGTVALAVIGMLPLALVGLTRYLLMALPLFLVMAHVMRRRPVLIAFWIVVSVWSYWNIDLCTYTGGPGTRTLQTCGTPHWVGRI